MADLKVTSCGSIANIRTQFNLLVDDVDAIRTSIEAITAKLDADAGVTDTDYNSEDPAAKTSGDMVAYDP